MNLWKTLLIHLNSFASLVVSLSFGLTLLQTVRKITIKFREPSQGPECFNVFKMGCCFASLSPHSLKMRPTYVTDTNWREGGLKRVVWISTEIQFQKKDFTTHNPVTWKSFKHAPSRLCFQGENHHKENWFQGQWPRWQVHHLAYPSVEELDCSADLLRLCWAALPSLVPLLWLLCFISPPKETGTAAADKGSSDSSSMNYRTLW